MDSLNYEILMIEIIKSTPVFLPGESHGQRNLVGYSPLGSKELDTTEHTSMYLYYKIAANLKLTNT